MFGVRGLEPLKLSDAQPLTNVNPVDGDHDRNVILLVVEPLKN